MADAWLLILVTATFLVVLWDGYFTGERLKRIEALLENKDDTDDE